MAKLTNEQRALVNERTQKWNALREWYAKAEEMQEAGESEVTLPIEVFLYAKEVPKNVEAFWKQALLAKQDHKCINSPVT